ncbi:T9SS type A sorting domain-containing protein [Dyadobacter sp. CY312]|uniref:T9SS type A sorting domain-containing protein n=1 Tax=Dyadobacter sp. CY312 TaxID=2907303 RepID=UPI001F394AE0|nr:T9SS type A sorting domain-containing protein [Dyadobacter sp. CY312]MCE7043168.1 T9SS type A sorting domain-containing protein [Dyadobacter sp. CY312]
MKLLLSLLIICACFVLSTQAQGIRTTLNRGANSSEVIVSIRNNGSATYSGNLTKFLMNFRVSQWQPASPKDIQTLPNSEGNFSSSQVNSFGSIYNVTTWTGSKAISLAPNQEINIFKFNLYLYHYVGMPEDEKLVDVSLVDGNWEQNFTHSIMIDNIEVKDLNNTFYNGVASVASNSEIRSSVELNDVKTIDMLVYLPVKLAHFGAQASEQIVKLDWSTVAEANSREFEVQHSIDSKNWSKIAVINANGESNSLKKYLYDHGSPIRGTNYYRLKMVDNDDTFAFSKIVSVNISAVDNVYPNPVAGVLTIPQTFGSKVQSTSIYNSAGREFKLTLKDDNTIDMKGLNSGHYVLKVLYQNGQYSNFRFSVVK